MKGETVQFQPFGNSMSGKIESGQLVTVEPVDPDSLQVGEIVLCKVGKAYWLHLIKAKRDGQFLIGNNHGHENGWTRSVYGRVTRVE